MSEYWLSVISIANQVIGGDVHRASTGVLIRQWQSCLMRPLKSGMKLFIRTFFKTLRIILGPLMLLKEKLTQPKGIVRLQAAQQNADLQCQSLALYQYKTCPFCMKVRQEIGRLSLNIQRVDAQPPGADRDALTREGGLTKVPCLKITDATGKSQWLYDSEKIVGYLRGRFATV
jgi:glutaredoxin